MSVLLVAINSRFSHTNLAVRTIANYVKEQDSTIDIKFDEWTISEPILEILKGITEHNADLVLFSVYIWNCSFVYQIAEELKKIRPNILIGAGGPEVSYKSLDFLQNNTKFDFFIQGEGEIITYNVCALHKKAQLSTFIKKTPIIALSTFNTPLINDLSVIPFPYKEFLPEYKGNNPLGPAANPSNRILYYESSRGCPFSCSYCLSSIDKSVRFMPLERVFKDLQTFLDAKVRLVKFVDRTFNLNENRYTKIWEYIRDHYNGVTRFHFEIAAECLSESAIKIIPTMPKSSIQFEIGVQSTNPKTLSQVGRKADLDNLQKIVNSISPFVHTHLDLIAGLPFESLSDFKHSFDYVFYLKPAMLQLGFLKILDGTKMAEYAAENNFKKLSVPPYEVLETPHISWDELLFLKKIEKLNDAFWNSGLFSATFDYLLANRGGKCTQSERELGRHECDFGQSGETLSQSEETLAQSETFSPFEFYTKLLDFAVSAENKKSFNGIPYNTIVSQPHKSDFWFSLLNAFFLEKADSHSFDSVIATNLLKFDFIKICKTSNYPDWFNHFYNKDAHHKALQKHTDFQSTRLAYANSAYDEFEIDPFTYQKTKTSVLFLYSNNECKTIKL